ncbi:MAG TPA: polyhydroxyalkanoate synthesis regulator DNA-binding domain-containing protein [Hyphomonadaceae bacterium]|jgi:polyhydroxyalkanoate synthesis repressor PhaR|nr:polyhydroxyalkanoate synthesis regulator DNA-binding domain-containing protein [Hyphomonadaceae bacterium]
MSEAETPVTVELRRYPSRKLYNKNSSSYVRLPEVAEMVRKGAIIRVEDTETGEDVTRAVLLQIIMEQEGQQTGSMLSADLMMDMIRLHQSKASEMMTGLFEQSVAFIRAQQEQIATSMSTSMVAQPWNVFDPAAMQEMQRQYQQRLASFWQGVPGMPGMPGMAPKKAAEAAPANDEAAELRALKARLEELEKRVSKK